MEVQGCTLMEMDKPFSQSFLYILNSQVSVPRNSEKLILNLDKEITSIPISSSVF